MISMENLADEIERLREQGIGHCLSDKEIDECFIRVLKNIGSSNVIDKDSLKKQDKTKHECPNSPTGTGTGTELNPKLPQKVQSRSGSLGFRMCSLIAKVIVVIGLIMTVLYTIVLVHPPTESFVERTLQPHAYHIMRCVRYLSMPIYRTFDLAGLYQEECLVSNPLHLPPYVPCEEMENVDQDLNILTGLTPATFMKKYQGGAQPFLLKNGLRNSVTYPDLQDLYKTHKEMLLNPSNMFSSSMTNVHNIGDLLNNFTHTKLQADSRFQAEWRFSKAGPAFAMRRLFHRPEFIPPLSEVTLHKVLYVDAVKGAPYATPIGNGPHMVYTQGSGRRHLVLMPALSCVGSIPSIRLTTEPGDMLLFSDVYWHLQSMPVFGGESAKELSVALLSSFS